MSNIIIPFRANLLQSLCTKFNCESLSFDGVDDRLDCGDFSVLSGASAVSVSIWFKTTEFNSTSNRILLDFKEGTSRILIQLRNLTSIFLYVNGVSGNFAVSSALGWHSLVYVFNGSGATNADKLKLYINNVEIIASSYTATVPTALGSFTSAMDSIIGALSTGTNVFVGNIDEVSIFDRAVNLTEIVTLSTAPTVDLTSLNPIAWYRNGDNGSYKSPQWLIPNNENKDKVSNYSLDFDGVDDYVDCGNAASLDITSSITLSCWMRTTNTANSKKLIMKDDTSANRSYQIQANRLTFGVWVYWWLGGGVQKVAYSNINNHIVDGNWHNVVTLFKSGQHIKLYVDGVEYFTQNVTETTLDSANTPFIIGSNGVAGTQAIEGNIDEVSVFDRALDPAEITAIYGGGTPNDLSAISNLVSWWRNGEEATFAGGVWTVPDAVGSNTGTSANMTIEDRIGEAPNSTSNALSLNMDFVDVVPDVPN